VLIVNECAKVSRAFGTRDSNTQMKTEQGGDAFDIRACASKIQESQKKN